MLAQENILKALTEAYAKYAPSRKMISDVNKKKESFFIGNINEQSLNYVVTFILP